MFSSDYYREDDETNFHTNNGNYFYAVYQCYSTAFLPEHGPNDVENGGKILLPAAALVQLSEQTEIMLFKLNNPKHNRSTHCGVLQFTSSFQPYCYLPTWMMRHLLLDEGDQIHVESVYLLPTATFVRFQPKTKHFLDITNPKAVLEKFLRNFSCLTKGDLISINYLNHEYELLVLELKPSNVVSIIECDIEVDFAPAMDSIETKAPSSTVNDQQYYNSSTAFTPFCGQGERLNGNIRPNDVEGPKNTTISRTRGIPNYDYKYGLLQFPRMPLRSINDDINEILEKNLSQSLTGERKILRQSEN